MSNHADPGMRAARHSLAATGDPAVGVLPSAIPAAELRRVMADVLDSIEQAGQLLRDLEDPGAHHDREERRLLKAHLLQVLPLRPEPGDADDACADLLTVIPGDMCAVVTRWLSAARASGTGARAPRDSRA